MDEPPPTGGTWTTKHGGEVVILLTRLNGTQVGINADLIERVEASGDTVVSLIDGTRYVVSETCADVVDKVVEFRARVLIAADAGLAEMGDDPVEGERGVRRGAGDGAVGQGGGGGWEAVRRAGGGGAARSPVLDGGGGGAAGRVSTRRARNVDGGPGDVLVDKASLGAPDLGFELEIRGM